jgi:hypothetical protein
MLIWAIPQITNPKILELIPLSQIRKFLVYVSPNATANFLWLIRKPQIRKFLQNTAQLCLKTEQF